MNAIQFVQNYDKVSFSAAVEIVKQAGGSNWEKDRAAINSAFVPVAEPKDYVTYPLSDYRKYEQALADSPAALQALAARGIDHATAQRLHVGFRQDVGKLAGKENQEIAACGWLVFPCIEGDRVVSMAYRSIAAKKFCRQPKMRVGLFGSQNIDPLEPVYVVEGECFPGDTEVLTRRGWVRLDAYGGQDVAQYNLDGTAEFVKPLAIIDKEYNGPLTVFQSKSKSVNLWTTPDHRILFEHDKTGLPTVLPAKSVPKGRARFLRTALLTAPGVDLTDDDIRLQVAIQADASVEGSNGLASSRSGEHHLDSGLDRWRAEFSKPRKVLRFRELLSRLGLSAKEAVTKRKSTIFRFSTDAGKYHKVFPASLYEMSFAQRQVFIDEIAHWDGSIRENATSYTSVLEPNVDLVQWAYHMNGYMCKKNIETNRKGVRKDMYRATFNYRRKRGHHGKTCAQEIKKLTVDYSGHVYCVQVPSSFLVTRKDGTVVMTGNCDALTLDAAGYRAVALPGAATNITPEMKDQLMSADSIVLAGDNDDPGRQCMSKLLAALEEKAVMITWPPEVKDANEAFLKTCGQDKAKFKEMLEGLVTAAKANPMPHVYDLCTALITGADKGADNPDRLRFPWPEVDGMIHISPGNGLAVSGTNAGIGKTPFLMNILMHNARIYGRSILLYSAEQSPAEYARPVAAHVTHKSLDTLTHEDCLEAARKIAGVQFLIGNNPDLRKAMDVMDLIESAIKRFSPAIWAIDTLHHICVNEQDTIKAQENVARRCKDLQTKYKNIGIEVLQPRKAESNRKGKEIHLSDPRGSAALMEAVSGGLFIHRELKKREEGGSSTNADPYEPLTKVNLVKGRYLGAASKPYCDLLFLGEFATFVPAAFDQPPTPKDSVIF
jgi:hypothetical protein